MRLPAALRPGLREFRARPRTSAVAVITLALGVAGATTMFAVINGIGSVMIPPGVDGSRVGRVVWTDSRESGTRGPVTGEEFAELRGAIGAFESVAAMSDRMLVMGGEGGQTVAAKEVTAGFFDVFGCRPSAGRAFSVAETRESARVALVSEALVRRHPGLGPGRVVQLGAGEYTIVGVLPDRCWFPSPGGTDVWLPMPVTGSGIPAAPLVTATARLRSPGSASLAASQVRALGRRFARVTPAASARILRLVTLEEDANLRMGHGLAGFLAPALVVLLLACGNVANLLLAQAARREREMAVRAALGASRLRLVRERLGESIWLGVAGGALGLVLAVIGVRLLRLSIASVEASRGAADLIRLDGRAVLFALGVTLAIPIVFGLVPALRASRPNLSQALHQSPGRRRPKRGPYGGRDLLVIVEIGLAVILVVTTAMFARFFAELDRLEWGFDASKVVAVPLSFQRPAGGKAADTSLLPAIVEAVRQVPGVVAAEMGEVPGLSRRNDGGAIEFEGCAAASGMRQGRALAVGPGYFSALGLPVHRGRGFTAQDVSGLLPVAIISEEHALRCWPGQDPIGRRIRSKGPGNATWMVVVGMVPDTMRTRLLPDRPQPVYVPLQAHDPLPSTLLIRSSGDPAPLAKTIRAAIRRIDRTQPLDQVERLDESLRERTRGSSLLTRLMGAFAAFALALAALGVFSVTSYTVAERTREFGIRLALGASRAVIVRLVLGQALVIVAIGSAVSAAGTLAVTRATFREMADLAMTDPVLCASVCGLLALVAIAASLVPARRAMVVEPVSALRAE